MMKRVLAIGYLLCFLLPAVYGQMVKKAESGVFLLDNAILVPVSTDTIQGDLLIRHGRIEAIADAIDPPGDALVINCEGKYVFPGFIDGGTQLGLAEIGSIGLTNDADEVGDLTPQMQALTAVNPNSVLIPVTRVNGITNVIAKPAGGMFPGTAALIHLFGYTPNQMDAGFHPVVCNFPRSGKRGRFDHRSEEKIKEEEKKSMDRLNEIWSRANTYSAIDSAGSTGDLDYQPELEALLPAVRKEVPLLINVEREKDILKALKWIADNDVRAVLTGVNEGWRVADSIAAAGIPVITGPVLALPSRSYDRYDTPYRNAGLMYAAGVKVALQTEQKENVRNLPYNAAFAATYGLGKEAALRAVTLTPAEIFGVDDELGSLDAGKIANLFVADGDPFETSTDILLLFIQGYKVPLESRQSLLYDEFLHRDPGTDLQGGE